MELIHNLSDFVVAINNKGNGGLSFDNEAKKLCISLTKEEWIDIIIALIHIALDPSTIFMEPSDDYLHEWTKKIDFTIILESTYEQN